MLRVYAYIHLKKSISRLILLKSLSYELDDQIKEIEKLLDSKKFQSHKKSKHQDILVNTLEVLHEIRRNGLKPSLDKLEPVRSDFHAHLEKNPSSEISTKLGEIYSFALSYQ
jgi:DNA-binding transcriptional MerR regulator